MLIALRNVAVINLVCLSGCVKLGVMELFSVTLGSWFNSLTTTPYFFKDILLKGWLAGTDTGI